jgi:hypothetical protein
VKSVSALTHNRDVRMQRNVVVAWLTVVVSAVVLAQVPASELAKPPANARHFIIQSTGGKHGDSWSWVTADGTRVGRESLNLRGQVFELDSSGKAGPDGMPLTIAIRGITPQGDAAETYTISGGAARWKSPVDDGTRTIRLRRSTSLREDQLIRPRGCWRRCSHARTGR